MAIDFDCTCGRKLKAKDEAAGKRVKCPHCQSVVTIPQLAAVGANVAAARPEPSDGALAIPVDPTETSVKIEPLSATSFEPVAPVPAVPESGTALAGTKQYKVLGPKDMGFVSKFDAARLEETLNIWAKQGWTLRSTVVMTHTSHSGQHHDLLMFLEK